MNLRAGQSGCGLRRFRPRMFNQHLSDPGEDMAELVRRRFIPQTEVW